MRAEKVKRGIREALKEKDIIITKIAFHGVTKKEKEVDGILKITLTLDDIDGIEMDRLKSIVDEFLDSCNISYYGMLLDI